MKVCFLYDGKALKEDINDCPTLGEQVTLPGESAREVVQVLWNYQPCAVDAYVTLG